jgi:hypothetical protein
MTMPKNLRLALTLSAAVVLAATGCSRDPAPGTEEAGAEGGRLMRRMSDALAGARAMQFTTSESLDSPGPPSERRVLRFTRSVTVRRPDALYFELKGAGDTKLNVTGYYDGRTLSLRDDLQRVWAQTPAPATLDQMLDDVARRYSMPVPFADVVYSLPYEAFIGPETKGGFVGRETIDGVECAHLSYADTHVGVEVWIPSSGQPLPRRVEIVYKRVSGEPRARMDFTRWDLAPKVADATFTFQPRADTTKVAVEQFVATQFAQGRAASSIAPGAPDAGPGAAR